ncbi:MAG: glycoside hydrolase family 32 protein [Clostridiales bacterium]|nr:glycoside hydrolase family 32 protein [Clostridiales bacterium]
MTSEKLQKARDYEAQYAPFIPCTDRPAFHLSPCIGWMNDPNGFSYYKGQYHLFYQYHPYSTNWGPMHWGHATSPDMLRWTYQPCALAPDQPYDNGGCFSGSAVELPDGRQLLLYTGVQRRCREDGVRQDIQTQCVAVGDGLNYEKLDVNPVLDENDLPAGGSPFDFRDPKIWQEKDGSYACVVGNRPADGSGSLLLYRSEDALHWHFDTIIDQCYNEFGKMWECPDFFPLDGKWVVLTSPQDMSVSGLEFHNGNGTLCIIGSYDRESGHFERERLQSIDYGIDFYATQTIESPDGRRIMVAWMQNWDACALPNRDQRWFGQMALPRELSIRNGRLIQNPIRELEQLHGRRVWHQGIVCEEATLRGVYGRMLDMTVSLQPIAGDVYQCFKLRVAKGSQHYTMITYKPRTSILRIDRSNSGSCRDLVHERKCLVRNQGGALKLRVILDRFSIELFVNDGEQALSTTIYTPLTADGISFECQGQVMIEVEKYDLLTEKGESEHV